MFTFCFPSHISSKPIFSGIAAEQLDVLGLLLWSTLPSAAGSVSPVLFQPFASTSALLCITKMSCTVELCLWQRLAQIITNNNKRFISVQCYKSSSSWQGWICAAPFFLSGLISCENLFCLQFALLKSISLFSVFTKV